MSFIRCRGLVKIYKAADLEVFALQGMDLDVAAGEIVAIIGRSGSGKSTLLNVLGGLDQPSAGQCSVGDYDLLRLSSAQQVRYQRYGVGFMWQNNARNLIPYLTALENVMLPMALAGSGDLSAKGWAMELLDAVGLSQRIGHQLTALSGGEQQRVAIALALANRPALLLADEPTGSVDNETAAQILTIFRDMNKRFSTTIVIVTHDHQLARAVDRYVLLQDGRIAQEALRSAPRTSYAGWAPDAEGGGLPGHDELVVIDESGRLQLARQVLEEAGIEGRARVQVSGSGILLSKP